MLIIDTKENLKVKTKKLKIKRKTQSIFLLTFFALSVIGCGIRSTDNPKESAKESELFYQRSIQGYVKLISQGKDLDALHFELGKLYFDHGNFQAAAEEFIKSNLPEASKYLGISYFHQGDFTRSYDVFDKIANLDDESRYFFARTSERLNLFEQALKLYAEITDKGLIKQAQDRSNEIEKGPSSLKIATLSPETAELIAKSPKEDSYPQAGALILLADETIEVTPGGQEVSEFHYLVKILNERGKEDFSETQIEYDTTFERVELEYARTITPDGAVTEVGSRHIRDVSKYLNFPLYSNAHVFIISFPEIADGSCVEYKGKIYRNQLINKKDFISAYPLQTSEPIIQADFTLVMPKEKKLAIRNLNMQYNIFGAVIDPEMITDSDKLIYKWHFLNAPQIIPEPKMPGMEEINPSMLFSTFGSWQEVYSWWQELSKDKIKPDDAIKEKVKELTQKDNSFEAKARSIHNFCAKDIRYVAVEYGRAGYEPHQAADIFRNKYGDCKDQAVLLVTMLREAGISAWPVLIATKDHYDLIEDFPCALFNHVIAVASINDRLVFMDPTAETCSFGDLPPDDQGRKVLVFKENGPVIEQTPVYPADHNRTEQDSKISLDVKEGVIGEKTIRTFGVYDQVQRYWLLYTPPELISDKIKETIQDVSVGAKLLKYRVENANDLNAPVVLSYAFAGNEYLALAGGLRILPQLASFDTSLVAKERRVFPIEFGFLEQKKIRIELSIPKNFNIKYLPENISIDSDWFSFNVSYTKFKDRLVFEQSSQLKKIFIQSSEYEKFKTLFEEIARKIKQRVVLEEAG